MASSESEIKAYWLVSAALADRVRAAGMPVVRFAELRLWGRSALAVPLEDDLELLAAISAGGHQAPSARTLSAQGIQYSTLLAFSAVLGFSGALISLLISRPMARWTTGARLLGDPATPDERWLLDTVAKLSHRAGIACPQVGVLVDRALSGGHGERRTGMGFHVAVIAGELVFGLMASLIVMADSRRREYRADRGCAGMADEAMRPAQHLRDGRTERSPESNSMVRRSLRKSTDRAGRRTDC